MMIAAAMKMMNAHATPNRLSASPPMRPRLATLGLGGPTAVAGPVRVVSSSRA